MPVFTLTPAVYLNFYKVTVHFIFVIVQTELLSYCFAHRLWKDSKRNVSGTVFLHNQEGDTAFKSD